MIIAQGKRSTITESSLDIHDSIQPGIITLSGNPDGTIARETSTEPYVLPKKIYGNGKSRMKRIFKAWKSRGKNTGVLLSGLKGSGKSLLLKMCCNRGLKKGLPIFVIDSPSNLSEKFSFLQDIQTPGIILFDEFEKNFAIPGAQEACLSFLDGLDQCNFLILFSVNSVNINENLLHRPGRIYYHYNYKGLCDDVIEDIVIDQFDDEDDIEDILDALQDIQDISYDVLMSLIHEMKTFGCDAHEALCHLNIHSRAKLDDYDDVQDNKLQKARKKRQKAYKDVRTSSRRKDATLRSRHHSLSLNDLCSGGTITVVLDEDRYYLVH